MGGFPFPFLFGSVASSLRLNIIPLPSSLCLHLLNFPQTSPFPLVGGVAAGFFLAFWSYCSPLFGFAGAGIGAKDAATVAALWSLRGRPRFFGCTVAVEAARLLARFLVGCGTIVAEAAGMLACFRLGATSSSKNFRGFRVRWPRPPASVTASSSIMSMATFFGIARRRAGRLIGANIGAGGAVGSVGGAAGSAGGVDGADGSAVSVPGDRAAAVTTASTNNRRLTVSYTVLYRFFHVANKKTGLYLRNTSDLVSH